jgi:hypothetical protein
MSSTASFHSDQTRLQVREERRYLITPQLLLKQRLAMLVCGVDLKHVLGQVDANRRNLHDDAPSDSGDSEAVTLARLQRQRWGRPSHWGGSWCEGPRRVSRRVNLYYKSMTITLARRNHSL